MSQFVTKPPRIDYKTFPVCGENTGWNVLEMPSSCVAGTGIIESNPDFQLITYIYGKPKDGYQCTARMGVGGSALSQTSWEWPKIPSQLTGMVIVLRQKPVLFSALKDVYGSYIYDIGQESHIAVGWQLNFTSTLLGPISLTIECYSNTNEIISELTTGYQQLSDIAIGGVVHLVYWMIVGTRARGYPKFMLILKEQSPGGSAFNGPLLQYPDAIQDIYGLPKDAAWLDTVAMQALIYTTKPHFPGKYKIRCFEVKATLV